MSDEQEEATTFEDITKAYGPLYDLLVPKAGSNHSELWQAWHFLQVYANWGLRLPTSTTDFTAILGTSPAAYAFFPPMQEANQMIQGACRDFLNVAFPKVIKVGLDLRSYAEEASKTDGEMFSDIIGMIESGETEDALQFLQDLQTDAKNAEKHAEEAGTAITAFGTSLSEAIGKLDTAKTSLDTDSKTNADALKVLEGGPDVEGSIDWYNAQLKALYKAHTEATAAAATSPLYIWVAPPLGLIATGTVMGIYTDKAIKAMKKIQEYEEKVAKLGAEKRTAQASRNVYTQASSALANVMEYTRIAGERCATVKNAWTNIGENLRKLSTQMARTTEDTDEGVELSRTARLTRALNKVEEEWDKLLPPLRDLLRDPYISVGPGQKDFDEVIALLDKR